MEYNAIKTESVYEEIEKRSKFISYSLIINNVAEAQEKLQKIKNIHHNAKHHVYAYVIEEGLNEKCSDDGEPSGTGGIPIINAIKSFNLRNVMVVIVRYFGGILLGTGGLRRMYSSGAINVLNKSEFVKMSLCKEFYLECSYSEYGQISNIISDFDGKIRKLDYNNKVNLTFFIKDEFKDSIAKKIKNIMRGDCNLKIISESYQKLD